MSIDLIVGVSIFFILLALCILVWGQSVYRMEQQKVIHEMQNNLMLASDMLVKSQGVPSAWENNLSKLQAIGLASPDGSLSQKKVEAFLALDYSASKKYLGILKYDYQFLLRNMTAGILKENNVTPTGDLRMAIKRPVKYGNMVAIMEFTVFSNHSLEYMGQPFL